MHLHAKLSLPFDDTDRVEIEVLLGRIKCFRVELGAWAVSVDVVQEELRLSSLLSLEDERKNVVLILRLRFLREKDPVLL